MDIKTLVFDYNGTLIDDRWLCLELLNKMLRSSGHPEVSEERYLEIFTFPIIDYYRKAGFLFPPEGKDDFDGLAKGFDQEYRVRFKECSLFPDVIETLTKYRGRKRLILLSATKTSSLIEQAKTLGILSYFDGVIGIGDIFAKSKLEEAKLYFSLHSEIDLASTLFIGDTVHDVEVGKALKGQTAVVSRGHQSKKVLLASHPDFFFPTLKSLSAEIK